MGQCFRSRGDGQVCPDERLLSVPNCLMYSRSALESPTRGLLAGGCVFSPLSDHDSLTRKDVGGESCRLRVSERMPMPTGRAGMLMLFFSLSLSAVIFTAFLLYTVDQRPE